MAKENVEPTDFSFESPITREELLDLSVNNPDIDKQCFWLPSQAFANGIKFDKDAPYINEKFGIPYTFPSFFDYIKWSGAWEELEKSTSFSYLYGIDIVVCLNDKDIDEYKGKPYFKETKHPATEIKAFYPVISGSGYWISKYDDDNEPEIYKIQVTNKSYEIEPSEKPKDAIVVYYVHASRVVRFPATQKDIGVAGSPKSYFTAHMAKAKEIFIESVVNAAKNMSAGTVVRRVANEPEMESLEAVNTTPSYKNRIYIIGGTENLNEKIQVYVPDLKSSQFVQFTTVINKYLASASNLSLRLYGEEDIGAGIGEGGAQFSTNLIQAEITDLQSHYQKPIEHVFFLLGKEDTSFEWNELEQFAKVEVENEKGEDKNVGE